MVSKGQNSNFNGIRNYDLKISSKSSQIHQDSYEKYEENNAINLGTPSNYLYQYEQSIHSSESTPDLDLKGFSISKKGSIKDGVGIRFENSLGDLNLEVYSIEENKTLNLKSRSETLNDNEWISFENFEVGDYQLKISGHENASNLYSLEFASPGRTILQDAYESNNSFEKASDLKLIEGRTYLDKLSLHDSDDVDIYKLELLRAPM